MYHLVAVPTEFTLIHGRFGQPEKNPSKRQAEIPEPPGSGKWEMPIR